MTQTVDSYELTTDMLQRMTSLACSESVKKMKMVKAVLFIVNAATIEVKATVEPNSFPGRYLLSVLLKCTAEGMQNGHPAYEEVVRYANKLDSPYS